MYKKLALFVSLLMPSLAFSFETSDVEQFFDEYQRLSSTFDTSLSQLYVDDAKIMGVRKKADGTEEKLTIDGKRWKTIILTSMEQAKKSDDLNTYSNVKIAMEGDQAKVTATRTSKLSCFSDERFSITVKAQVDQRLKIVEQFMESPSQSLCEDAESGLSDYLKSTVKMINEQLPAAIDAETQLIKTSSEGNKLTYQYVLINYTAETLSSKEASSKLQPIVLQQSCTSPNLRPILDQGGALSYIYRGSDGAKIVAFDIDKTACPN